jgi:hypothetical protein
MLPLAIRLGLFVGVHVVVVCELAATLPYVGLGVAGLEQESSRF